MSYNLVTSKELLSTNQQLINKLTKTFCGGNRLGSPYQYTRWAKGPVQGRTSPRPYLAEDKGDGLPLRVALRVIPWNKISTKTEKDNRRNENI